MHFDSNSFHSDLFRWISVSAIAGAGLTLAGGTLYIKYLEKILQLFPLLPLAFRETVSLLSMRLIFSISLIFIVSEILLFPYMTSYSKNPIFLYASYSCFTTAVLILGFFFYKAIK